MVSHYDTKLTYPGRYPISDTGFFCISKTTRLTRGFTYTKIPPGQQEIVARRLKNIIVELVKKGYKFFGAGGALGFDTLAVQTVLSRKSDFPQIRLILVLPCLSQADNWSSHDKEIYAAIKSQADKIVYTSREYTRGCMHKRNRHLVDMMLYKKS